MVQVRRRRTPVRTKEAKENGNDRSFQRTVKLSTFSTLVCSWTLQFSSPLCISLASAQTSLWLNHLAPTTLKLIRFVGCPFQALPRNFVQAFGTEFANNVTLQSNEDRRLHPVTVTVNVAPRGTTTPVVKFGRGWTRFVFNNSLIQGDRLTFTLISKNSFFVRIDRVREDVGEVTA